MGACTWPFPAVLNDSSLFPMTAQKRSISSGRNLMNGSETLLRIVLELKCKRDVAPAPSLENGHVNHTRCRTEYDFKSLQAREVYSVRLRYAIDGDCSLRYI